MADVLRHADRSARLLGFNPRTNPLPAGGERGQGRTSERHLLGAELVFDDLWGISFRQTGALEYAAIPSPRARGEGQGEGQSVRRAAPRRIAA
ncbi:hypothetical protein AU381_21400 [Sinorhizobium glycinis]|uniref:Uncharacterized protein n=1 Tax=Sinorhizobium glycinis TaxID=1472378 RepID=A0A178XTP8_9HYPH|nr:hypothetical protein AU381_21400 [Sinorhizobium glycinis]